MLTECSIVLVAFINLWCLYCGVLTRSSLSHECQICVGRRYHWWHPMRAFVIRVTHVSHTSFRVSLSSKAVVSVGSRCIIARSWEFLPMETLKHCKLISDYDLWNLNTPIWFAGGRRINIYKGIPWAPDQSQKCLQLSFESRSVLVGMVCIQICISLDLSLSTLHFEPGGSTLLNKGVVWGLTTSIDHIPSIWSSGKVVGGLYYTYTLYLRGFSHMIVCE